MTRVVVTALGRPWWLAPTLYALRERALYPVHITVVVDGDPAVDWHAVRENSAAAQRLADTVVVPGSHLGNGPAFATGVAAGPVAGPLIKCDADILPSRHYDFGLLSAARAYGNDRLLALAALQPTMRRDNVGIRQVAPGRRFTLNLAVFTPRALLLLGGHETDAPINDHERFILSVAKQFDMWYGLTERAWVDTHLGWWDRVDEPYWQWKLPHLGRSQEVR